MRTPDLLVGLHYVHLKYRSYSDIHAPVDLDAGGSVHSSLRLDLWFNTGVLAMTLI
jgi:hypothetical protein